VGLEKRAINKPSTLKPFLPRRDRRQPKLGINEGTGWQPTQPVSKWGRGEETSQPVAGIRGYPKHA